MKEVHFLLEAQRTSNTTLFIPLSSLSNHGTDAEDSSDGHEYLYLSSCEVSEELEFAWVHRDSGEERIYWRSFTYKGFYANLALLG